jgi:hypothetical protein
MRPKVARKHPADGFHWQYWRKTGEIEMLNRAASFFRGGE